MLNGKRPITERMKLRLGSAMGLETSEISKFKKALSTSKDYHQISIDTFAVMSDWYHYAILELTKVEGFQSTTEYVSKKIGITKSEANFAVERLLRLGFLTDQDRKWTDVTPNDGSVTNIDRGISSIGSKKLQRQILEKSIEALEHVPLEKRNHTSMTMVINSKKIEEAKEAIREFRRKFCAEFELDSNPDQVYNLHIGFYPVTKE